MQKIVNHIVGALALLLLVASSAELHAKKGGRATQDITFETITVEAQSYKSGVHSAWREYETQILSPKSKFSTVQQSSYGSIREGRCEATGFFRTQKIGDRWWVVDPDGYLCYQRAMVSVRPGTSKASREALVKEFGSESGWAAATVDKFRELNIYSIGGWSSDLFEEYNDSAKEPVPTSKLLGFMSSYGKKRGGTYQRSGNIGYPNQTIFVFDPEFESFCDEYAKKMTAPYIGKSSFYGYFSDNEMPLGKGNLEGYLTLEDPQDSGRKAAEEYLRSCGVSSEGITDQMREEFAGIVAERYYSIVSKALKKYDPDHMYMGSRLHGGAKFVEGIIRAASSYCDIVSVNFYGDWALSDRYLANLHAWGDAPFMITEFYTKSVDSGLANSTGAGFRVKTQQARGQFYQNFCLKLLSSKDFVGWQYFRYQDNDPNAARYDPSNVDSNKGIVTNKYIYYDEFLDYMSELNRNVYQLIEYFDNQE